MRVIIRNREGRAAAGLGRYTGSAILETIGRKLLSSGLRKIIKATVNDNLPQNVVNVIVDGSRSLAELENESSGKEAIKIAKLAEKNLKKIKRKVKEEELIAPPSKQRKIDINQLVNNGVDISGSGIILAK